MMEAGQEVEKLTALIKIFLKVGKCNGTSG